MAMYQSVMVSCLPADGLFLISDACLPECTIGLFQAKSDSSLQVIFIIPGQVNHIYTNIKDLRGHRLHLYGFFISLFISLKWLCLSMMSGWFYLLKHKKKTFLEITLKLEFKLLYINKCSFTYKTLPNEIFTKLIYRIPPRLIYLFFFSFAVY